MAIDAIGDRQAFTPQDSESQPPFAIQLLSNTVKVVACGATGYIAAMVFSIVDPVGGAIFGVSSTASGIVIEFLVEKLGISSTCAKVAFFAFTFIASTAIATAITTASGFPITFLGSIGLTIAMFVTAVTITIVVSGILCCSGCCLLFAGKDALSSLSNAVPDPQRA
jgi:hypothetical protein